MIKYFIFILCLYPCSYASHNGQIEVFQKLSVVDDEWLQATSIPEAAMMLSYPPYRYYSKRNAVNLNITQQPTGNKELETFSAPSKDRYKKCSDDLAEVILNVDSSWVLQMLDSDGKLSSGILRGGLIWPGHFHECHDVYAPLDKDGHGNFYGKYCATTWNLNLGGNYKQLPLSVGLCVPESCSERGIKTALINITHMLERFPVLRDHKNILNLTDVSCKLRTKTLDTRSIIFITFVSGFFLLVVVGSGITVLDFWKKKSSHPSQSFQTNISAAGEASDNNRRTSLSTSISNKTEVKCSAETVFKKEVIPDKSPLTENMETEHEISKSLPKKQDSVWKRVLLCFSALTNGQKVLNTDVTDGQLLTVHGVRFLSLTWVILGHTYIMSVHIIVISRKESKSIVSIDMTFKQWSIEVVQEINVVPCISDVNEKCNRIDVLKQMDSFPFQMLLQSPFSVDSFFLLSGFLLSYLFLKEAARKNGKINWIYFYCHRLWRLTPAYMVVVFFYMFVFKYMGSGPFWDDHYCEAQSGTWWKYLLYINNFIPIHQMCVGWSWYLANDMQFYIISPLLLYPLWRWPIIGFSLLGAVLILTWTITGVLSFTYDLIPMFVGVTQAKDFSAYEDKMWYSFDLIYDKPYCRIAPYIIGIVLGYMLYRSNQRKNFLNWWQQLIGWSVAAFCSLSVVFGLYHVEMSKTTALFYNTLCRSSFSIGLAWLIFACETGHGGFLSKFLSWKLWIPLSRLTYCAYLVHPILIHGYYQAYQTAMFFTELVMVTNFLGFLLFSYVLAFLFSLTFESPLMNLEKLVLRNKGK